MAGANTFDMVNNALLRQLERLDEINPASDDGKAEIARSQAVTATCLAAVDNANSTVNALKAIHNINGTPMPTPKLFGGIDNA